MSKYRFKELVNVDALQKISESIYDVAGIPIGIMGTDGIFYIKAGWQKICLDFHRVHPETCKRCRESDAYIEKHMFDKEFVEYKCLNGMIDIATPLVIDGEHLATIFLGQFFYENEEPDETFFVHQATKYDFDQTEYLQALHEVPKFSKDKVKGILKYYQGLLSHMIDSGKLRMELNHTLEESQFKEAKLNTLFNSINDLIFINDQDYIYREYISSNSDDLYVKKDYFIGKSIFDVLPNEIARRFAMAFQRLENESVHELIEYSLIIDDEEKWFSAKTTKIKGLHDHGYDFMTVVRDITDIKENEALIKRMAYYDDLTGLYNRTMFYEMLNKSIADAHRTDEKFAVVFMDLDDFKRINDTKGHLSGDILLKIVGERLSLITRESDTISRIGGDEFTFIINHSGEDEHIIEFTDRLMKVIEKPIYVNGNPIYVTTSIGIALYPYDGITADELIKNADAAMYQAKASGKNTYQLYNDEINCRLSEKIQLEIDLRSAFQKNEDIFVYYQPIVNPFDNSIKGFEALIRWNNHGKFIPPPKFIGIAEEIGLINDLGEFVLRQACQFSKSIQENLGLEKTVSINISAVQLKDKGFLERIQRVLLETDVKPHLLEFEITETAMIHDFDKVTEILRAIKTLGIRISLDDFGTGYSSLSYIKTLPLDTLKIDRLFINDICKNETDRHILEVIAALAKKLDFVVISEGVETKEQVEMLGKELTDYIQGYYYYRPMPEDQVMDLLRNI